MIRRTSERELLKLAHQFKAVAIVGPRQAGKTTLARMSFPNKDYVNLENPDVRRFALEDPRGFLANYPNGAILDEVQRVPDLFSYLQEILDSKTDVGQFILTGSNNFQLQENISQSLAGRLAYLYLLPFSLEEWALDKTKLIHERIWEGSYPPVLDQNINPAKWFQNYIRTYVERDVRQLTNVTNLNDFELFIRLCAGRTGQLLNKQSLSVEIGVDGKTISSWLSILEQSFVLFRLQPHHRNFNKRLVKTPKLYFYDTGLVCALLGIQSPLQLRTHPLYGSIFESFVVSELAKERFNEGLPKNLFFWRDNTGHEIDILMDFGTRLHPLEIKSGQTINSSFFKGLNYWEKLTGQSAGTIIYSGEQTQQRSNDRRVISIRDLANLQINKD
jgi:uncharacterized protein